MTQPLNLKLVRLHLASSWKRLARIVAILTNQFAQDILVDIKITSSLRDSDTTVPDQLHCFKLILADDYLSMFMHSGFRRNTLFRRP